MDYYLSIPPHIRCPSADQPEKHILRKAVEKYRILPPEILNRTKEAFSDGVSSMDRPWYHVIQEKISAMGIDDELEAATANITHNPPKTLEQKYYRMVFERHYPGRSNVIPYFWMPRFVDATDASARTLKVYNASNSNVVTN